jgi:DNA-binding ferritin-like protein
MNIISPLIQFQQQLRIFHWQTSSYAQHQAFGSAYEELDDLVDSFVEKYMGTYGRSKPIASFHIILEPLASNEIIDITIDDFVDYLKEMDNEIPSDTELLNIRDEILGEVRELKYQLSLK